MVMLDPVAFDDVNSVDEGIFKQAAIWGTVYQVQNSGGSLDQYERDPDTGSALIPGAGDRHLHLQPARAGLPGDGGARSARRSSSTSTTKKSRPIWCPSPVRWRYYTPTVEKITKKDGQRIVTVGYVPTSSN